MWLLSVIGVTSMCFHVNGTSCNIYQIIMDSNVIMCACLVAYAEERVTTSGIVSSLALHYYSLGSVIPALWFRKIN